MTTKAEKESAAPAKVPEVGPGLKIGEDGRTYARVRDIDPRHNIRTVENDASLKELAGSIKMLGVRTPLSIVRGDKSPWPSKAPFVLLDGGRRLGAAKLAEIDEVPVQDETDRLSAEQMRTWQIVANLQRKDLTPLEEARAMDEWLKTTKKSTVDLGKEIGKSDDYVRSRINLLRLPEPAVKAIEDGRMTVRHGAAFNKIPDEFKEERAEFVREVLQDRHYTPSAERLESEAIEFTKRLRKEKADAKKLSSFKFSECPEAEHHKTTGLPRAAKELVWGTNATLVCAFGHRWSGKTGKRIAEPKDTYQKPKREKVEKIDRSEPPTIRSPHDAITIAVAILKAAGVGGIEEISYEGREQLRVQFKPGSLKALPASTFGFRPVTYTTGEKTQVVVNGFDSKERKADKKDFVAWQGKALPKIAKSPRASTKKADAKILDGAVSEVVEKLEKVRDDETLELVRELERQGKKRGGVFDAIDTKAGITGLY